MKHDLSQRSHEVYQILKTYKKPRTAGEISNRLQLTRSAVSPRLAELVRLGLVRRAGTKTCAVTGKTSVTAWEIAPRTLAKTKPTGRHWYLVQNPATVDPVVFTKQQDAENYAVRVRTSVITVREV